ncbi:MAG: TIGR03086 family protein [Nocardiopsaceae bacterium]|nr:TIGR03086 family protein [Nocardiopsaceae bacterium]
MKEPGPLEDLERALAGAETIVAGITPGQWTAATPCDGLDVRGVVSHLVTGNLRFAALARGNPAPAGDDLLGDDPAGAFSRAAAELAAALGAPGALDEVYKAPWGRATPGSVLAQVRITEQLGHGWDLARATGQPVPFPADLAERTLATARMTLSSRPEGPGAPFGPAVPVPDSAPAIDRLAGFLGRAVA